MCASALLANGALAQTITVQPLTGVLSLNQGQGFHRVAGPVEANVGDSFMVGPGGSAKLIYPDGCQVTIQPGSVVNVTALSPCASGAQRPMPHPPSTYYPAAGAPLPGQPPGAPLNQQDSEDGFALQRSWVVGLSSSEELGPVFTS
jgi:hypothetical protein